MQTGIIASHDGTARSSGSAPASGIASRCLRITPARRRGISGKKKSWKKYNGQNRAERQISPHAVELAESRLSGFNKLNTAKRRALFYAVQCLTHYDKKNGVILSQGSFSSEKIGRYTQEALVESGLAKCLDWDSWKPTNCDFRNAKSRAFIPSWELIWADFGETVVSNFADYCRGKYNLRPPLHQETQLVLPCAKSGVKLHPDLIRSLNCGTGLNCDFNAMHSLLLGLPEDQRSNKLCAAFASVGRMPVNELRPIWHQHEWGRLYCSKPALMNMPKVLLSALRSFDGLNLWNVDFSSFELRISCDITGQKLPDGDIYGLIARHSDITRERVKAVINPMLHGQTMQQLWYTRELDSQIKVDRLLVEKEISRTLPTLFSGLDYLRKNDSILQRKGAEVFFHCMCAAMDQCEIRAAGVPKHDGWVFPGTESQARAVSDIFEAEAERVTAVHFPVKLEAI